MIVMLFDQRLVVWVGGIVEKECKVKKDDQRTKETELNHQRPYVTKERKKKDGRNKLLPSNATESKGIKKNKNGKKIRGKVKSEKEKKNTRWQMEPETKASKHHPDANNIGRGREKNTPKT